MKRDRPCRKVLPLLLVGLVALLGTPWQKAEMVPAPLEIAVYEAEGHASAAGLGEDAAAAFAALGPALSSAIAPLRQALEEHGPDEIELRLELALKGEAKWIVVSAAAAANIGVKMTWKREK